MTHTVITALWGGFVGSPGYTRFRYAGALTDVEAQAAADEMRQMFADMVVLFPPPVQITWNGEAAIVETNGQQSGIVSYTPPAAVNGAGTAAPNYAGPVGAVISWLTDTFRNGRRIRGRTFLVPMTAVFDASGSLSTAARNTITTAVDGLGASTPSQIVFSPPRIDDPIGVEAPVTNWRVPDLAAVLRSRRD